MTDPHVVVLALWPGASLEEVEDHRKNYQFRYPGAKLETLSSTTGSSQYADYEKSDLQFYGEADTTLIHIFGDDAAARVCALLRAHYSRNGRAMNVEQLIFDSAPVSFLARTFSKPYQILVSACSWICAPVMQAEPLYDDQTWVTQDLESGYLLPATVKRYYVSPLDDATSRCESDANMESGMYMRPLGWLSKANLDWKTPNCSMPPWAPI